MFFEKIILGIIADYNLDIDITGKNHYDIFMEVANAGVSQREICSRFEKELNAPFSDIMDTEPDFAIIKKITMTRLRGLGVYPYSKDGILYFAISEPTQLDMLDTMLEGKIEFVPVFSFDFVIEDRYAQIEEILENEIETNTGKEVIEVSLDRKSVLLATGQDSIDAIIESPTLQSDVQILDKIHKRELIIEKCEELNPEIVIVGENIGGKGTMIDILLQLRVKFPQIRIIYLAGKVNPGDDVMLGNLGLLVSVGIYDILATNEISFQQIQKLIHTPMEYEDVKHFTEKIRDSSGKKSSVDIRITVPEEEETEDTLRLYENVYSFISPQGAVGKSTIVQNLAITLDKYAMPNIKGRKPRIAIIDLDFQGFSTSRFFDTINKENHIFAAIDAAAKAIDDLGEMKNLTKIEENEIHDTILHAFVPAKKYKNIYVLGGDDKVYERGNICKMTPYLLTFIIESVVQEYDVILIDANTTIECNIAFPLYHLSNIVYNILDVSTQCFNMNKRYLTFLEDMDVYQPLNNKFILNKAFDMTDTYLSLRDIEKGLGIDFKYTFPKINDQTMFNLNCKNESIIESNDDSLDDVKVEFMTFANEIIALKNFQQLVEKLHLSDDKLKSMKQDAAQKQKKADDEAKKAEKAASGDNGKFNFGKMKLPFGKKK